VAFAIGRAVGTSVVRNQLRRRLRALLAEQSLPDGWYLVGARPGAAARSFDELRFAVSSLVTQAARPSVTNTRSSLPDDSSNS
jgi:ribonuclease P protein component